MKPIPTLKTFSKPLLYIIPAVFALKTIPAYLQHGEVAYALGTATGLAVVFAVLTVVAWSVNALLITVSNKLKGN
jgi:hypothetical protein